MLKSGKDLFKHCKVVKKIMRWVEESNFWRWVKKEFAYLKRVFMEEYEIVVEAFKKYGKELWEDLKKLWNEIFHFSHIRQLINWIESWFMVSLNS